MRDYQERLKWILPGSMPERLMGTDCKFVGNMSTLVQIQLGPKIFLDPPWNDITHLVFSKNHQWVRIHKIIILSPMSFFQITYIFFSTNSDFAKHLLGSVSIKSKERVQVKKEKNSLFCFLDWFFNQVGNNERIASHPCR